MTAPRRSLLPIAAWLLLAGAAALAGVRISPAWGKLLSLIVCAGALRIAFRAAWLMARPVHAARDPQRAVVRLRGEINTENAERITQRLLAALSDSPTVLEIDLAAVSRITHRGTQAFFDVVRAAKPIGVPVVISNANPQVRAALHGIGLDHVLRYTNSD
ncbi:STAS domain-containing protein [Streptomyces sp. NBC_01537]|uniref:STAS domain-containing protein n=1 Tax=Streptomyces sp. NBC_01537 TaxID=2903896 RepID=UPI0038680F31